MSTVSTSGAGSATHMRALAKCCLSLAQWIQIHPHQWHTTTTTTPCFATGSSTSEVVYFAILILESESDTGQESHPRTFGPDVSVTNTERESHIRGVPRHARRRTLVAVAVEAVEAAGAEHEHGLIANGSDRRARVQGG